MTTRDQVILARQWRMATELPQDDEWKLCCCDDNAPNPQSVCIAHYNAEMEEWIDECDNTINIDWWMDIPPLPKYKVKED